jgi:hypothetical protein
MSVHTLLGDPDRVNYKPYLACDGSEQEKNTIELFAFGDYRHYQKYRENYIDLDPESWLKLIKLTALTNASKYEGTTVLQEEFCREIAAALAIFQQKTNRAMHVDQLFIELVDQGWVELKLDDALKSVRVENVLALRDAYCGEELRVLHRDDVADKDVQLATEKIRLWSKKLTPNAST